MIVKPAAYTKLVAVKNGKLINIDNRILRKPVDRKKQDEILTDNSVCIVCNFTFLEKKIEWSKKVKAICHPFRNTKVFPKDIQTYLFSESDFCDRLITPCSTGMKKWDGKYDFVYFTLNSNQGVRSKGLHMINMIDRVAGEKGLKGLVIGYQGSKSRKLNGTIFDEAYQKVLKEIDGLKNLKVIYNKFDTNEVCAIMRGCKFALLPNTADASPRLLAEPIVRGVPVVVNRDIYGGWKYVSDKNGSFFDGLSVEDYLSGKNTLKEEMSLSNAIDDVLLKDRDTVSNSFYEDYGFRKSSKKLAKIINNISGTTYKAVAFRAWEPALKKTAKIQGWI
jgi:hypothetical protein